MKRLIIYALVLFLTTICGCFEVTTEIKVKKDGSGTVTETVMISKEVLKGLNELFGSLGGAKSKKKKDEIVIYNKKELKAEAKNYGEGVKYKSSRKLKEKDREGYRVVYAFQDINQLNLNQNPGDRAPKSPGEKTTSVREEITFNFEKGPLATLLINFPKAKSESKKEKVKKKKSKKKDKKITEQELKETKQILKDMRISISVYPQGEIVQTNAMYVDGQKITLMEIDFNELIADAARFKEFVKKEPETLEEAKKILKKLKSVKLDLNDQIIVKFK